MPRRLAQFVLIFFLRIDRSLKGRHAEHTWEVCCPIVWQAEAESCSPPTLGAFCRHRLLRADGIPLHAFGNRSELRHWNPNAHRCVGGSRERQRCQHRLCPHAGSANGDGRLESDSHESDAHRHRFSHQLNHGHVSGKFATKLLGVAARHTNLSDHSASSRRRPAPRDCRP